MKSAEPIDLWFSGEGDFALDASGDLKDTSSVYARSLVQEIRTRLAAATGDWKLTPMLAANVQDFLGRASTDAVLRELASRISDVLTVDNLMSLRDFTVSYIKLFDHLVVYRITLNTPEGELFVHLGYNTDHKQFMGY
jgi:hypothetical protein